ncbi:nucleoside hydrolase [Devosia sp. PTR5]|uniref:Nucleoside hydrolase n=1 Tax=Devosia oryzisoli TaxID=2774138 RepID=A0A927FZB7_9HYPH|nr:nucleoside hydrolase [Devosia oryzisoli]MBD8066846.1 nucleoside hydrolase [Devosia oryzisoli]
MSDAVIIDTDPGLDDAIAILFALGCGRFDVLGLTSVAGNIGIEQTTANAGSLLRLMGSSVPVAIGAARPLRRESIDEAAIHGDDGLGGVVLKPSDAPPLPDAVAWMTEQLTSRPAHTVDVLALGPLTNLARLIETHPEAAARIGRVIAMGGAIDEKGNVGPNSEFNFASDPEALQVVLVARLDLTLIPLDVTRRVRADAAYLESLRGTAHGEVAAALLRAYFHDGRESRPLHDPCVMLFALAPDIFAIERMRLAVDLVDDPGAIRVTPDGWPAQVAMAVDTERALSLLRGGFI